MLNGDVLTGLTGSDDVLALLRSAEIIVDTSDTEGFPHAMLEAWSVGAYRRTREVAP